MGRIRWRAGQRRQRVEDAEQRVAELPALPGDQLRIVEVVAGVDRLALTEPGAKPLLEPRIEQGDLDARNPLRTGLLHDPADRLRGLLQLHVAPVSAQARIECLASQCRIAGDRTAARTSR